MKVYKRKKEKKEREERLELAEKLEKSWELARTIRSLIKNNTSHWDSNDKFREKEKRKEEEKEQRIAKAEEKKLALQENMIQRKIWES